MERGRGTRPNCAGGDDAYGGSALCTWRAGSAAQGWRVHPVPEPIPRAGAQGDGAAACPRVGAPLAREYPEARARALPESRPRSRVGRRTARARRARGPARPAARRRGWSAAPSADPRPDGTGTVPALRSRHCARAARTACPKPDPQGPQAGERAGGCRDEPGPPHGLWHRVAASARAPVARAPRAHRRDAGLHGPRADWADEPLGRFAQRPLRAGRDAVRDAHRQLAVQRCRPDGVGALSRRQRWRCRPTSAARMCRRPSLPS